MESKINTIHVNRFLDRQTSESQFSHFTYSKQELVRRVEQSFAEAKQGYREGVLLVDIRADGAFCPIKFLEAGDELFGEFSSRVEGEAPRKHFYCKRPKVAAVSVEVILYSHSILAETSQNETDADFEIISFNTSPTLEASPIMPFTLMANHFGTDGGSSTNLDPADFEKMLRKSYLWWADKILCKP